MTSQNLLVGFFTLDMRVESWGTTRELHLYYGIIFYIYSFTCLPFGQKRPSSTRPILCSCRTILFVHARNRGGCRRTDCREVYPLGASPHSSFNLNRIRLACLVGCLEEYDNRLRAQITFLLQIKMYLTMTMATLPSKRRKYDRG